MIVYKNSTFVVVKEEIVQTYNREESVYFVDYLDGRNVASFSLESESIKFATENERAK